MIYAEQSVVKIIAGSAFVAATIFHYELCRRSAAAAKAVDSDTAPLEPYSAGSAATQGGAPLEITLPPHAAAPEGTVVQ